MMTWIRDSRVISFVVFVLVTFFPGAYSLLQQGGPDATPIPNDANDTNYVYMPMVIRSVSSSPPPQPRGPTIIDHYSVDLFDRIPESYLTAARNLRMVFADASVGQNIHESLDCLTAPTWSESLAPCRRDYYNANWDWKTYDQNDYSLGLVPSRILFTPSPTRYNRSNWTYEPLGGSWSEMTQEFIQSYAPRYLSTKDVLSYQFSYLYVAEGSDIADPNTGFFSNNPNRYDIYDLANFWAQHPNKRFFLWTTSLARGIGTQVSQNFNNQVRQYGVQNNVFVFDVADIESHTPDGRPCYDNRDGVQYCSMSGQCENHPNDHLEIPAICQDYTTESDGGHLGSVSAGRIRLAKAYWVLMARLAGWDGR